MFREILQKLAQNNFIVTLEYNCCIVKDKVGKEISVISYLDKERDEKLKDCYYSLIS